MITEIIVNRCTKCESENIVKNGTTKAGRQKYHSQACNAYGTLNPSVEYAPERKAEILHRYHERSSLRGIERTFGVARQTVAKWLKEKAASLPEMPPLEAAQPADVLELDELWSFVEAKKTNAGFG
jgi:transposase-like protein